MKRLLAISLAVVLALGLVAGAVMALTQPSVSLDDDEISAVGVEYTIMFTIAEDVAEGEYIIIAFPDDTDITNVDATDCTIAATSGIGSNAFVATTATSISKSDAELTITVPDVNTQDKIGTGATVEVIVDDVLNPSIPGDYTLTVATSEETTPVESATYAIEIPAVGGIVQLYNPADILMAQYTGDDAIQSAIDDAMVGYTVKVGAGTYKDNIELKDGVQVLGEGADVTTIDGGGAGSVVTAIGVGSETVLDGFTITAGFAEGGGGVHIEDSQITVTRCAVVDNWATYGGGISVGGDCSPSISGNLIDSNSASQSGGGISIGGSVSGCRPTIVGNTISRNSARNYGGGIYFQNASPIIVGNLISGNTIEVNYDGGGIHHFLPSEALIVNNIIVHNSAVRYGGGIDSHTNWLDGPHPTIVNNVISFNSATNGGGMRLFYSRAAVSNNIISNNDGEGIYCLAPSEPLLMHNDVWNNSGGNYGGVCPDPTGTEGNISADPMFVDPAGDDYHLQGGSPCIDAGTNEGAPTEDIEGNPRPIDGDGDGTATTDMGAYEYVPPAEPAIEATVDFDPDTLNLKSKGKVVTVYIELPEGYDVEKTDISTVMLNGIVPALAHPTDVGDYDSDRVPDLMVKFDRSNAQDMLEPGDEVEVTVSGQLTDGTSFEGADTIRVIDKY